MSNCITTSAQEASSAVVGNIGIVHAKVEVWDHDPFLARPNQNTEFAFTQQVLDQARDQPVGVLFEAGGVVLEPVFTHHDMWIGTKNKNLPGNVVSGESVGFETFLGSGGIDLVGTVASNAGQVAFERLPGGKEYEQHQTDAADWRVNKDIFPHQLWLHVGSLLRRGVLLHPSEYTLRHTDTLAAEAIRGGTVSFVDAEVQDAPRWELVAIESDNKKTYWPVQTQKKSSVPVHWTLEKFTPTWQNEDFFVTIKKGDKDTDDSQDNIGLGGIDPLTGKEEIIGAIGWSDYVYLMYDPTDKPLEWFPGMSNEAFFVPEQSNDTSGIDLPSFQSSTLTKAREKYWWKFKTYILIEIGVGDPGSNYFIELVKGRNPRFLHLGEEWDNPARVRGQTVEKNGFGFFKKCRQIGQSYTAVSCDELFSKNEFRISVRSHLGRLVITFTGYEHAPWVITRLDNKKDTYDFEKTTVPIIIPAGKIRIHGGNISTAINFSPTEYTPKADIIFRDIQSDTCKANNNDVYMTFAHMGGNLKWANPSFKRSNFGDKVGLGPLGYSCDAGSLFEIHRNSEKGFFLYENFRLQFSTIGKGWIISRKEDFNGNPVRDPDTGLFIIPDLLLGMDSNTDHRIIIYNARDGGSTFPFGIDNDASDTPAPAVNNIDEGDGCSIRKRGYPYAEYVSSWDIGIRLVAGTVTVPAITDQEISVDDSVRSAIFPYVITPTATNWRLVITGGNKATDNVRSYDISPLVTSINDSWSAEGYTTLKHEMQLKCYIPVGQPAVSESSLHSIGQRLLGRVDKSTFITVSYWWDNGVGERDAIGNRHNRGGKPENTPLLIQMTGIAYGAKLEKSINKLYINFAIKDYMSVLEKQFIFNSPFFDGVADREAIHELGRMAGFDDQNRILDNPIDRSPLGYLKHISSGNNINKDEFFYNGEQSRSTRYDLPGSYADLANPAFRFNNGETYDSAMKKIARVAGKTIYFDRWGVLKYETSPGFSAGFNSRDRGDLKSMFDFVTTPFKVTTPSGAGSESSITRFNFDPNKHASHLVYEVVQYSRSVEDCINQIVLLTATNERVLDDGRTVGGLIVEGYTFYDQIWNVDAEGFLGFNKPFYQSNGVFGSVEHARLGLDHYAKMKHPPASISFQTYGVPGLKALDIITLDDNMFYITQISHEIDPSTNRWWMNVTGEWLKPFLGNLGFLEERDNSENQ